MKGLLIKDFCLTKEMKNFIGIIVIISAFLLVSSKGENTSFVLGYTSLLFSFMVMNTVTYDEQDNGYSFLLTLPVSRRSYVVEKYCFGLIMGMTGWLFGLIEVLIAFRIFSPEKAMQEVLAEAVLVLGIMLIAESLMTPLQLKFGADKGRIMLMVLIMALVLGMYGGLELLKLFEVNLDVVGQKLGQISLPVLAAAGVLLVVVIWLISIGISFRIMEKKEL